MIKKLLKAKISSLSIYKQDNNEDVTEDCLVFAVTRPYREPAR